MTELKTTVTVHDLSSWETLADELPSGFESLREAAHQECRVEMTYSTPGAEPSSRVVRPRLFYALGSQYYMQAYCERANAERTFRLDRIAEFRLLEE
jgi:predicted DNA-binding transcriptional regulator YafY